jgi:hypothetical protein
METQAVVGYRPRRGGRYDSREDRSPTPEPPGTHVFSREIRTASFPQRFRQPTNLKLSLFIFVIDNCRFVYLCN